MKKIILASGSPRRVELLKNAGFNFKIIKPDIFEIKKSNETPDQMVRRLSLNKAIKVSSMLNESAVIVSADTTVVSPDGSKVLGKPTSHNHAVRILSAIQGKTHTVITAYTILDWNNATQKITQKMTRSLKTKVTLRSMNKMEIMEYIKTGEPMDKAGAYAAQGIGMTFIHKIVGSYSNVVGLPICEVANDLKEMGCERSF